MTLYFYKYSFYLLFLWNGLDHENSILIVDCRYKWKRCSSKLSVLKRVILKNLFLLGPPFLQQWVKSLNKVSGFYQFSAASFTFGRAPNILSSTTKGNHFQKYKKVFTNKSIPMRKIPPTLGRKFQIKTEKLPLFRTNIAELHSYAKPYTTKKQ